MKNVILLSFVTLCLGTGSFAEGKKPIYDGIGDPTAFLPVPPASTPSAASPAKGDAPALVDSANEGDGKDEKKDTQGEPYSGKVNVLRQVDGRTEIMFRSGDVFYLPGGAKNAPFFEACQESERSGKEMSFVYSARSRVIQSISGVKVGASRGNSK